MSTTAEKEKFVLPTSGTIHIKPRKDSKVVGHASYKAKIAMGASGDKYELPGRNFGISGDGVILNMAKPENRKTYDILMGPNPGIRAWFNPAAKFRYRFDIVNLQKEADDYLANDELKTDYKSQVVKLKPTELKTIGYFFRLGNDPKMIKAGLYKMIDNTAQRAKVGKFLLSADRQLLLYINYGLKGGDEANKKGLYKNSRELFFFNDTVIGLGEDTVIAYLKKETEDSASIYNILKEEYEQALLKDRNIEE
jgi:hypothetical protein